MLNSEALAYFALGVLGAIGGGIALASLFLSAARFLERRRLGQ